METSSWGGFSAERGLAADNQKQLLCDFIAADGAGDYPAWFLQLNRTCPWSFVFNESNMPASVRDVDAGMQVRLGAPVELNSLGASLTSAEYRKAVTRYALAHPRLFARRFFDLYPLFWQRLGNYGAEFSDPFQIDPVKLGFPDLFSRGFHEKQRVALSSRPPFGSGFVARSAAFGTVSLAPLDAISIIVLHLVFPLLLLTHGWRRACGRDGILPPGTGVMAWTAIYGVVVFNAVEGGENMRFRLAIEPVLICLTAVCVASVIKLFSRPTSARPPR